MPHYVERGGGGDLCSPGPRREGWRPSPRTTPRLWTWRRAGLSLRAPGSGCRAAGRPAPSLSLIGKLLEPAGFLCAPGLPRGLPPAPPINQGCPSPSSPANNHRPRPWNTCLLPAPLDFTAALPARLTGTGAAPEGDTVWQTAQRLHLWPRGSPAHLQRPARTLVQVTDSLPGQQ